MGSRRKFTDEFKREAVRLASISGSVNVPFVTPSAQGPFNK